MKQHIYLVSVVHGHANSSTLVIIDNPLLGLASILGGEGHLESAGTLGNKVSGFVLHFVLVPDNI